MQCVFRNVWLNEERICKLTKSIKFPVLILFLVISLSVCVPLEIPFSDSKEAVEDNTVFNQVDNNIPAQASEVQLRWAGEPIDFRDIAWKHDGTSALLISLSGRLLRYDGIGFEEVSNIGISAMAIDWSPNDDYALIVGTGGLIRMYNDSGIFVVNSPTTSSLNDISFYDHDEVALAVGDAGTVLKWDGQQLSLISAPTSDALSAVDWHYTDPQALICGNNGLILIYNNDDSTFSWLGSNTQFRDIAWNADVSYSLIVGFGGIVIGYDGLSFKVLTFSLGFDIYAVDWNPMIDEALLCGTGGKVVLYNESAFHIISSALTNNLYDVSWKDDGSFALLVGDGGLILSCDGTALTTIPSKTAANLRSVHWSAIRGDALISGGNGVLLTYDPTIGATRWLGEPVTMTDIAWKPDGSIGIIVGYSGLIITYDGVNFEKHVTGLNSRMNDVAWRPDGTYAIMVGEAGQVVKYNGIGFTSLTSGVSVDLYSIAWNEDGSLAAIVGDAATVLLYDQSTFEELNRLSGITTTNFKTITWFGDSIYIAGGFGTILEYNTTSSEYYWHGYGTNFRGVSWCPDGSSALIVGYSGAVIEYDSKAFRVLNPGVSTQLNDVSWNVSGNVAVFVGNEGIMSEYNGSHFWSLSPPTANDLLAIEWSPDGSLALVSGTSGLLMAYNGSTYEILDTQVAVSLTSISWTPSGSYAIIVGSGGVVLKYQNGLIVPLSLGRSVNLWDVSWSPDGSYALIVGQYYYYKYDGTTFTEFYDTAKFYSETARIAWRPDGAYAYVTSRCSSGSSYRIWLWDGATFTSYASVDYTLYGIAWHPSGEYILAVGNYGEIISYDGTTVSKLTPAITNDLWDASWSPDGSHALIVGRYYYLKYDGLTFTRFYDTSKFYSETARIAWRPDGAYALVTSRCNPSPYYRIWLWDGTSFTSYASVDYTLYGIAWHPSGSHVLAVGAYGEIVSYDGVTLTRLTPTVSSELWDASWSPDGSHALIVGRYYYFKYDGLTFTKFYDTGKFYSETAKIAWRPDGAFALVTSRCNPSPYYRIWRWDGTSFTSYATIDYVLYSITWPEGSSVAIAVGASGQILSFDGYSVRYLSFSRTIPLFDVSWKPTADEALIVGSYSLFSYDHYQFKEIYYDSHSFRDGSSKIAWGSDGQYALISDNNYNAPKYRIWKYDGSALSGYVSTKTLVRGMASHPYGGYVVAVGDTGEVIRHDGIRARQLTPASSRNLWDTSWKPDGSHALIAGESGEFLEFDSMSYTYDIEASDAFRTDPVSMDWSPNGMYAVIVGYSTSSPNYRIWSYDGATMVYYGVTQRPRGVSFIPSGDYSLIVGDGGSAWKYDAITVTPLTTGSSSALYSVAWKPDGEYALIVGSIGTVLKFDGSIFTPLVSGVTETLRDVSWNQDGSEALIVGDNGIALEFNGTHFNNLFTNSTTNLLRVDCGPNDMAFAVGLLGTLLFYNGSHFDTIDTGLTTTLCGVDWSLSGAFAVITGYGGIVRVAFAGGKALFGSLEILPTHIRSGNTAAVRVRVTDGINPVDQVNIVLSATFGTVVPSEGLTGIDGIFDATYTSPVTATQLFDSVTVHMSKNEFANNSISSTVLVIETTPPNIVSVSTDPVTPDEASSTEILAQVEDAGGVLQCILSYSLGADWTNTTMSYNAIDELYHGTIPKYPYPTAVSYVVFARDTSYNWNSSGILFYTVQDASAPEISSISISPSLPSEFDAVLVSGSISDPNGVDTAVLQYRTVVEWTNITMNYNGATLRWDGEIPAQSYGTTVFFRVLARDTLGNWGMSGESSYSPTDAISPNISSISMNPPSPSELDFVDVSAVVVDSGGVILVLLSYTPGGAWTNTSMIYSSSDAKYHGTIPSLPYPLTVFYKVYARDLEGNWAVSSVNVYTPTDTTPPEIVSVNRNPYWPSEMEVVDISAELNDLSSITQVIMSYVIGAIETNVSMSFSYLDGRYHGTIPGQTYATIVGYLILASDSYGNWRTSSAYAYTVGINSDFDLIGVSTGKIVLGEYQPTTDFSPGETVFVSLLIENNGTSSGNAVIIVQVYDPSMMQVWIGYATVTNLSPGQFLNITLSFTLRAGATVGEYSVNVDVQSAWSILNPSFVVFDLMHNVKFNVG